MLDGILICPVCKRELIKCGALYKCSNNHCFDVSKKGHVNLLLKGGDHGDDRGMLRARRDFLTSEFYKPFSDALCNIISENPHNAVLDMGCGEGYYTANFANIDNVNVFAFDVSKYAAAMTAACDKRITAFTASSFNMPVKSGSIDIAVSIFAPFDSKETLRVLKKGGLFVAAFPLSEHLLELKQVVYDDVLLNPEDSRAIKGLDIMRVQEVKFNMTLERNEHIKALFSMTPYVYRTERRHLERLDSINMLSCRANIGIAVYKKI